MKFAFRVDASADIGLGHLVRCLSLAQALDAHGAECHFVTRDLDMPVLERVAAAGFTCSALPAPDGQMTVTGCAHASWAGVSWEIDARQSAAALLARGGVDWVVVDHYAFESAWHAAVRQAVACRMAVVDDLGDRQLDADVLIDHNHAIDHRAKYAGRLSRKTEMLCGPAFALLAPRYADAVRHVVHTQVRSIGIFMGGADRSGYSLQALAACDVAGFDGHVEVVATSAHPHLPSLTAAVHARANTRLSLDLPDLAAFFARHDLQIGASGGSTWERCCIGAPTLAIIVADNQRHVLLPLASLGVLHAVEGMLPGTDALARSLRQLIDNPQQRASMAARARQLIDGRGASRVAAHLTRAPC